MWYSCFSNCFHRTIAWVFLKIRICMKSSLFLASSSASNPIRNQKLYIFALHFPNTPKSFPPTNSVWFLYGLPNSCTNMFLFTSVMLPGQRVRNSGRFDCIFECYRWNPLKIREYWNHEGRAIRFVNTISTRSVEIIESAYLAESLSTSRAVSCKSCQTTTTVSVRCVIRCKLHAFQ